ncbi:MAG TPA: tetratricopeptide repeat protein [Chitinophagaceae bacterium]
MCIKLALYAKCIMCFFFFLVACNNKDERNSMYLKNAFEDLKSNRFSDAYKNANKAINIKSDNPTAFILRGRSSFEMGHLKIARKDFEYALKLDVKNISALYYLGLISYDLDDFNEAEIYFNKAIILKGTDSVYFESSNRFSEFTYDENVSMPELRFFRGLSYYYMNQYKKAANDFIFVASEDYNKGECYFYIGAMALDEKNNVLACKYLNLALENGYKEASKYLSHACN